MFYTQKDKEEIYNEIDNSIRIANALHDTQTEQLSSVTKLLFATAKALGLTPKKLASMFDTKSTSLNDYAIKVADELMIKAQKDKERDEKSVKETSKHVNKHSFKKGDRVESLGISGDVPKGGKGIVMALDGGLVGVNWDKEYYFVYPESGYKNVYYMTSSEIKHSK